jgi:hypothetical protein
MFDAIVRSLPRNKLLKVNRLMQRRAIEVAKVEDVRDLELAKLYPEIKKVSTIGNLLHININECSLNVYHRDLHLRLKNILLCIY